MTEYTFRPASTSDHDVLEIATFGNMNWCGDRFTLDDIRREPQFAHYTRVMTERGDFGIIAEQGNSVAGAAWAVLLPVHDAGYGYVDESTPELSLWVEHSHRRLGLGRKLLIQLIDRAEALSFHQLSLSVEDGNPAKDLYLSLGFTEVEGRENDGVMLKVLGSQPRR